MQRNILVFILAAGFCPKNLAFAQKIMTARVWGAAAPQSPWLVRLWKTYLFWHWYYGALRLFGSTVSLYIPLLTYLLTYLVIINEVNKLCHLQSDCVLPRSPAVEDRCCVPLRLRRLLNHWSLHFVTFTRDDAVRIHICTANKRFLKR